jgi:hypothetical protein
MGWLGTWIDEWRETYRAYPVATVVTWVEMLVAVGLFVGSLALVATAGDPPDAVGVGFLAVGVAFAVWFSVVRAPVVERLVSE